MARKAKASPSQTPEQTAREPAKDLLEKVGAIKALVVIHELLNQAEYPGYKAKVVIDAVTFIESLHRQLTEEVRKHKDADLIPGFNKGEKQNV